MQEIKVLEALQGVWGFGVAVDTCINTCIDVQGPGVPGVSDPAAAGPDSAGASYQNPVLTGAGSNALLFMGSPRLLDLNELQVWWRGASRMRKPCMLFPGCVRTVHLLVSCWSCWWSVVTLCRQRLDGLGCDLNELCLSEHLAHCICNRWRLEVDW